ncbi:TetR family transcriptional regulator [Agrobacterium sp. O3.4]|uniref:TetR family transcriptional regulator n=1 Tax=Agrobacterium cucumeris TaxID=2862866 RepID=A0ABY8RUC1_9HYPH|nr:MULTISPECIES: TetR family transcriptional regulator [Rhizobium/Agrobacterium group]MCZ7471057.1 TetR family transcriptional regulator [Rhizobium rhizogenes]MCZ7486267.1 TetR family transcriptional regulator [Rhizobium rhizogenes]MDA5634780.1 TetR family transcriptional regulator [Agrobacterium sp. ST15.16.024]MDF1891649.1 TetR family transcriptional regulator [Rhizobium rhizogenes]WHO10813.1 TetR family transcriptional regulator [Agrobacterium cucumeris]
MRRTKEQAAETGRQILQAAETLFLDKGYDNVSLEEIAALSGVTRGAIHWHFKNKHGLLLALRNEAQEPFRRFADELSEGRSSASIEKLGDIIADTFRLLEQDPRQRGLLRVMMRLDIVLAEKDEAAQNTFPEEMHELFVRIFRAVERNPGMVKPWTPEKAASMLYAAMGGLITEWALSKSVFTLSEDGSLLVATLLAGVQQKHQGLN